jgi:hypothetical protein
MCDLEPPVKEVLNGWSVSAERAPHGPDLAAFPARSWSVLGGRPAGGQRDRVHAPQRPAVGGCAQRVGASQDFVQQVHALEPLGAIRAHLRGSGQ